tara:strand:- start:521 stop:850 length:330 start_codon:yes stop_codon:yes gene_type:complete
MFEIINDLGSLRYYNVISFINNKTSNRIEHITDSLYKRDFKLDKVIIKNIINFKNYMRVYNSLTNVIENISLNKIQEIENIKKLGIIISIITVVILIFLTIILFLLKKI